MISLEKPNTSRGLPVMQALASRRSPHEWTDRMPSMQDISDLLWAANGVSSSDGRRTAPSAMNSQEVDVYLFNAEGIYRYDATKHALDEIEKGDHRAEIGIGRDPSKPVPVAPLELVLVSGEEKFPFGTPEQRRKCADLDVGIVSENIAIFCAGVGFATRPRASINAERLHDMLHLGKGRRVVLDLPVGYAAGQS